MEILVFAAAQGALQREALFFVKPFKTNIAFDLTSQNLLLAQRSPGRRQSGSPITAEYSSEHRRHS